MKPFPFLLIIALGVKLFALAQFEDGKNGQKLTVKKDDIYDYPKGIKIKSDKLKLPKFDKCKQVTGSFTDPRDNKTYQWVQIDNQIWMAQNLAFLPVGDQPEKDCEYWVYGGKKRDLTTKKT
jgi:hypothetical protein